MGFLILGIISMIICIFLFIIGFLVRHDSEKGSIICYAMAVLLLFLGLFYIRKSVNICTANKTGTYTIIENSNGSYISIDEDNICEVITEKDGIQKINTFYRSNTEIFYIDTDEQPRLEIDKGYWSVEYKVYIPKPAEKRRK